MSQGKPTAEKRFKHNIDDVADFLFDICSEIVHKGYKDINLKMIGLAIKYVKNYTDVDITEDYVYHSCRYWEQIRNKEREFFDKNLCKIFGGLPLSEDQLNMFQRISVARDERGELYVNESDIQELWDDFHCLTKIAIHYLYDNPDAYKILKIKLAAAKNYNLDLDAAAKLWGINR